MIRSVPLPSIRPIVWPLALAVLLGAALSVAWCSEPMDLREAAQALLDPDPVIRKKATEAFRSLSSHRPAFDETIVQGLAKALWSEDTQVRVAAAEAFSYLTMLPQWRSSPKMVDALIHALEDPEPSVVKRAGHALGHVTDPRAVLPLIAALRADDAAIVNVALGALNHLQDYGLLKGEAIIGALIESLEFEQAGKAAASLLALVSDEVPLRPLVDRLSSERVKVRRGAALALAKIGTREALGPLSDAIRDEDQEVRRQVTLALGRIGGSAALPPLTRAAEDPVKAVRLAAVQGLERGGSDAMEPLLQRLRLDESPEVRFKAAIGLRTIQDNRAARPLLEALKHEENLAAWLEIATGALGHWNSDREVARAIVEALKEPDPKGRRGAALALQVDSYKILLVGQEAVRPLAEALTDQEDEVRKAAAGALKQLAQRKLNLELARDPLKAAAHDADPTVRRLARETLGLIGHPPQESSESGSPAPKP